MPAPPIVVRGNTALGGGALDTLQRGCAFLAGRAGEPWLSEPWPVGSTGIVRARLLGNWLREMDSFLHHLIDEVTVEAGGRPDADRRSAAARWRLLPFVAPGDGTDRKRLLGLHRSQLTFWQNGGLVQRPDHPAVSWLTAGWPNAGSGELRRFRLGERLAFGGADLIDTCRFYERLGAMLVDRPRNPERFRNAERRHDRRSRLA